VFEGIYQTEANLTKLQYELDFQRATLAHTCAIPLASFANWQEQHETVFGQEDGEVMQMVSSQDRMAMLTLHVSTTYRQCLAVVGSHTSVSMHRLKLVSIGVGSCPILS
jgi:hypothetical protein